MSFVDTRNKGGFMNINQIVRLQEYLKQSSQDYDIIRELLGKKSKSGENENIFGVSKKGVKDVYIPTGMEPRTPNWEYIMTKGASKMSDEEFEQAIIAKARSDAEYAMKMGDASYMHLGKRGVDSGKLENEYVSCVAADRKAAWAAHDKIDNVVKGIDGQTLMSWGPSGWIIHPTEAEKARMANFREIYNNATEKWISENGQIPCGKPGKFVPIKNYL
jgi:hypothetical protein